MTVQELIEQLAGYPADLRVVVNGYEEGYDDLSPEQISLVKLTLNTGKNRWEGEHGEVDDLFGGATDGVEVVEGVALRRVSN